MPEPVFHYAMIRCACGDEPPDHVGDDEAIAWLVEHLDNAHHERPVLTVVDAQGRL